MASLLISRARFAKPVARLCLHAHRGSAGRGLRPIVTLDVRGFSSGPKDHVVDDDDTDKHRQDLAWEEMSGVEKGQYLVSKYGLYVTVGTGFTYIFTKSSMYITNLLTGISFKTVGYWGFVAGFNSGLATTAGLYAVTRGLYIRPENVRNKALGKIKSDSRISELMGSSVVSPIRSGVMRAYTKDGGTFALDATSRRPVWRPPRIKLMFQIYGGNNNQAIVTTEAHRTWNGLVFDFISVDKITGESSTPIIVDGDASHLDVKGQLRDLVQLKKRYVP